MDTDTIIASDFSEAAARLIADITGYIKFPADEEFEGVIDDCIDAMDGRELPPYYTTLGFDLPEIPQDGLYLMMALHYLMDAIDERHIELSDELRSKVDLFWDVNGIRFEWDKERFICKSFFPLEEDRISVLKEYRSDLEKEAEEAKPEDKAAIAEKLLHLDRTISTLKKSIERDGKPQSKMETLKMLIKANGGTDPTEEQLVDFNDCDA